MTPPNPTRPSQKKPGSSTPQGMVAAALDNLRSEYRWLGGEVAKPYRWLGKRGRRTLEWFLDPAFAVTRQDGLMRFGILVLVPLALWIAFAWLRHPIDFGGQMSSAFKETVFFFLQPDPLSALLSGSAKFLIYLFFFLQDLVLAMFSADIFRHVIAIGVPAFIAIRIATLYLSDIFELERERTALHFIFKAAFGLFYSHITITGTQVEPDDSPMLKIGGPGIVQVNLENAAVFDHLNGDPHVIPPTASGPVHFVEIESFERFREAIDLREQIIERGGVEIMGRTRDGLRITAKDIRMIFSVVRNEAGAPLSYDVEALKRLVYNRAFGYRGEPWQNVMVDLVHRRMQHFIATHDLSWFLAAADVPDFRTVAPHEIPAGPTPKPGIYQVQAANGTLSFTSRFEVTQYFFDKNSEFAHTADLMGMQLQWIDVGTWATPARVITERQLEAWKIASNNQVRRKNLELLKEEGKIDELLILARSVPLIVFRQSRAAGGTATKVCDDLVAAYLGILRQALEIYTDDLVTPPPQLQQAIDALITVL